MAILAFQMPDKVVMEKADDFQGLFEFKPLEPGYGVTIGNALRRVLLSSLEGYAIVGVRIPSVLHEFTTIEGVVEDVTEIVLNLKMLRFKALVEEPDLNIRFSVSGQSTITGADINKNATDFEVLNPEQILCHLDESVEIDFELYLDRGKGYVPAEENRIEDQPIGHIPIDAIFTPIKNVRYNIENTRVEQRTDYEKLLIEIQTDGSIHPEEALKQSATLLIKHLMLISDQHITLDTGDADEEEAVDEEMLHMRKLLKTQLSDLDLSVRAFNCLKAANVRTLGDLVDLEISDMMKFRNFGKKSLTELEQLVADKGLTFGMDVAKYRLDED
ncbi:MAG: DNA-directed RNA polymerase subunit alpha [Bernardetiaceae bacterium]|nr:DNA-directed RNA polymerase subunit alpha [Bernardetiaceae bacterium]